MLVEESEPVGRIVQLVMRDGDDQYLRAELF